MFRIGERHVALDEFLNEQEEVVFLLLLPSGPTQRIEMIRRIIPTLVSGHDIKASEVYVPCFIKAIEDTQVAEILDGVDGCLVRKDGAYDAWQKTNSRVAHELMQLFEELPIEEDGRPTMPKTTKAILTEIALWMRETPSEDEAKELLNFFLKEQGGYLDKILEEALRKAMDTAFPMSRIVPLYIHASAKKRPCENRDVVCKVLFMAIAHANDWFLHNVFSVAEPLLLSYSEAVYPFLVEQAKRVAVVDAKVKHLVSELMNSRRNDNPAVEVVYDDYALQSVKIEMKISDPGFRGDTDTVKGYYSKMHEVEAAIVRRWQASEGIAVRFLFQVVGNFGTSIVFSGES
jgi:hypothetical protein